MDDRDAIREVMGSYYNTFGQDEAAAFFGEPTVVVLSNEVIALSKRPDIEAFIDRFVASLKPTRLKADGTEIQRAGFTYLLQKGSSGWKIHGIIATDLDKL